MKNCYTIVITRTAMAILDLVTYEDGLLITRINVPKEFRSKGVGRALLKRVLKDADRTVTKLYLFVSPSDGQDFSNLSAWYIRHGFKYHGPPGSMVYLPKVS